jgi:predicted nucleic acid-binding Zn finger protein
VVNRIGAIEFHITYTCADFIFRGNAEGGYECKHVAAVLKFIGRGYLCNLKE